MQHIIVENRILVICPYSDLRSAIMFLFPAWVFTYPSQESKRFGGRGQANARCYSRLGKSMVRVKLGSGGVSRGPDSTPLECDTPLT